MRQIYFANKLIRWCVFEAVQKNVLSHVLSGLKHSAIASFLKPDKTLLLVFYCKHYYRHSKYSRGQ